MHRFVLGLLALVAPTLCLAQEGPRPPRPTPAELFQRMDTNHDKALSLDEFTVGMKEVHQRLAALRGPEGAPPPAARGAAARPAVAIYERLKAADANGDGKLSREEAPDRLKKHFDRADTNHDGALDQPEIRRVVAFVVSHHKEQAPPAARVEEKGREEKARAEKARAEKAREGRAEKKDAPADAKKAIHERLKAADANGDGKLSREEAPDRLKQHFDKIDANGDGQLDPAEIKKALAEHARGAEKKAKD